MEEEIHVWSNSARHERRYGTRGINNDNIGVYQM